MNASPHPAPVVPAGQRSIAQRIGAPSPEEVRQARERAGLTQTEAALLVSSANVKPYRTWQNYEAPRESRDHRPIRLATWELFLLLTQQHPSLMLTERKTSGMPL